MILVERADSISKDEYFNTSNNSINNKSSKNIDKNIALNKTDNITNIDNNNISYKYNSNLYGISIQKYSNLINNTNLKNPLIAVSSINVDSNSSCNYFSILNINETVTSLDNINNNNFVLKELFQKDVDYPLTKVSFNYCYPDILATSDCEIKLYKINENISNMPNYNYNNIEENISPINNFVLDSQEHNSNKISVDIITKLLISNENNSLESNYLYPITSFDWNLYNPSLLASCSTDTTCSIWDIQANKILTRLIAHDKEVYDISFHETEHSFLSAGADGEIRLFDLRDLDSSQIVFDTKDETALTRISVNPLNPLYVVALCSNKSYFYIIDLRDTSGPIEIVNGHSNAVNCVQWSESNKDLFCTGSDDKSINIWDVNNIHNLDPIYTYTDNLGEVNNVFWMEDIIGIVNNNYLNIIKSNMQ